VNTEKNK